MNLNRPFYVTTPIYYVNDAPHIGHVYTTVAADAAARWMRSAGRDVFFLTGIDEHGQKVAAASRERNLSPQEHCDQMVGRFTSLWKRLDVSNDDFIRTTEKRHREVVGAFLSHLHEQGDVYKASYIGWYCVPDERFWTEKDLVGGRCPDCGREVGRIEESNWFFRMGKYQDRLVRHIEEKDGFLLPESRRNEILGFLRQPLGDLCISRPKSRLSWGIEIPFDPDYVTYVWFDALVNYASAPGFLARRDRFLALWEESHHLIGKDILVPHAVYWPTMLMGMGVAPPRRVFAHGWWTVEGKKMSKSLGNVVEPNALIDRYGADALRYFLLREIPFGADGDFSHAALAGRINADLANDLGNLLSRSLGMLERYRQGVVPPPAPGGELEAHLSERARETAAMAASHMEDMAFNRALEAIWDFVGVANKYVDSAAPWTLAREGWSSRLDAVLWNLLEAVRQAAVMVAPFLPATGEKMFRQIGISGRKNITSITSLSPWGGMPAGTKAHKGESLFPRIEDAALTAAGEKETSMATDEKNREKTRPEPPPSPQEGGDAKGGRTEGVIGLEEFGRVRLVAGLVLEAERVPRSRKLVRLVVDIGEKRQIVAGIGERYAPEDLVGRRIAVVANLAPAVLMGVESRGMLLAATDEAGIHLVTYDAPVAPGSPIK